MIRYSGDMKPEDMQHLFSTTRLIRTETSTLIGLLLKNEIDYNLPAADVLQRYVDKTEVLLEEIHHSMSAPFLIALDPAKLADKSFNPFASGAMLRESIFYAGESAYSFQYRELSPRKYANDDEWLKVNKGFSIQTARDIVYAIGKLQDEKAIPTLNAKIADQWASLSDDMFSVQEIADITHIDRAVVEKVLTAFAISDMERNNSFSTLHDFNIVNATPLLRFNDDAYSAGNLYISDSNNNRIRKVLSSGTITTVAGNGTATYSGDNGPATLASLNSPDDVAVDIRSNLLTAAAVSGG